MNQLSAILEEKINETASANEEVASYAVQFTKVKVNSAFTDVKIWWLCDGVNDEKIEDCLERHRHSLRKALADSVGVNCPELHFLPDRSLLMEQEMDKLFRMADYGMDYRAVSHTGRVLDCDAQQGFDFCSANTTFRNDAHTTTSHGSCSSIRIPFHNECSQPWLTVNNLTSDLQACAGTLEPYSAEIAAVRNIFFNCDDLFWRNPHTIVKKVVPDNGLALWGDPEIAKKCTDARPVRHWLVGEGQDE
ncbi:hypothetical protein GCK32_003025, partial [Trichostrongylus colubriformis]